MTTQGGKENGQVTPEDEISHGVTIIEERSGVPINDPTCLEAALNFIAFGNNRTQNAKITTPDEFTHEFKEIIERRQDSNFNRMISEAKEALEKGEKWSYN